MSVKKSEMQRYHFFFSFYYFHYPNFNYINRIKNCSSDNSYEKPCKYHVNSM